MTHNYVVFGGFLRRMIGHLPGTLWSSARHYLALQQERPVGPVDEGLFDDILSRYDDDVALLHVGLNAVRDALDAKPCRFVRSAVGDHFA
jgi:hypothetical protein